MCYSNTYLHRLMYVLHLRATATRFWYREPKPRSNFAIGIGARFFFSETEFFFHFFFFFQASNFSHFLPTSWEDTSFYKLENKPDLQK